MSDIISRDLESVYAGIKNILDEACSKAMRTVNFAMARAYWKMGRKLLRKSRAARRERNMEERIHYRPSPST